MSTEDNHKHQDRSYLRYANAEDLLFVKTLNSVVDEIRDYAGRTGKEILNILDLGCGVGNYARPLSALGHNVFGVDVHDESIEECKKQNCFPNAEYEAVDGCRLKEGRVFDVVICIGVVEHVEGYTSILENIHTYMREDSLGIINIPNGYSLYEIVISRFLAKINFVKLFHKLPAGIYTKLTGSETPYNSLNIFCDHVNFFSYRRFIKLLSKQGLNITKTVNLGLGIFLDWKCFRFFKRAECRISDHVPHSMAGSWNYIVTKVEK